MDGRSSYQGTSKDSNEVSKLIRDNYSLRDVEVYNQLREKHGDKEAVNKIFAEYEDKMSRIRRKAQKFAQLVLTRYNHLGTKKVMEKARKLKKKYGFSDDEFSAFVNLALSDKALSASNANYNIPFTPMGKTLGYAPDVYSGKMTFKPNEAPQLQEILAMYQESMALHNQVVLQSLTYKDCSLEALRGQFDRTKNNAWEGIHPVLAALFIPRLRYLDEHMLIGNIANIVSKRYQSLPIKTQPDWELYWDMISDPNEMACDNSDNPITDLRNRVKVQIELLKQVYAMRKGSLFMAENQALMVAIDNCKYGVFDSPELTFVRDEGTIFRKLLNVFSLRPTVVSISPLTVSPVTLNYPINNLAYQQITTVPIINLRIPINKSIVVNLSLGNAMIQPDQYVENKMIVTKQKQIIYSRDVAFFYINRRFQQLPVAKALMPYSVSSLPTTVHGLEQLNDYLVDVPDNITIGEDGFRLRSAIALESETIVDPSATTPVPSSKNIIVSSSAWIIAETDLSIGRSAPEYIQYHPYACGQFVYGAASGSNESKWGKQPFTKWDKNYTTDILTTSGTIFVYQKY